MNKEKIEGEEQKAVPYSRTGFGEILEAAKLQREKELSGVEPEGEDIQTTDLITQNDEYNTNEGEVDKPADEELVTIVVDGEKREVPKFQVYEQGVRTLQKEAAADKRLEDANRRLKDIEQREAEIARYNLEQAALQQNSNSPPPKQDVDVQAQARQIIDKILDGDEEEAAKALADVMGRNNATPIDHSKLIPEVAQQVQRQIEGQRALQSFQQTYPEIVKDPFLFQRTDAETIRVHNEHPEYSTEQVLMEAGRRTKDWISSISGSTPGDETPGSTKDKVDKKRTTENLKSAHARNPAAGEIKPPSRSEVVAMMRKRRGLPEVG